MPDSISALPLNELGIDGVGDKRRDNKRYEDSRPAKKCTWFKDEVAPHEPSLRAWLRRNHPVLREQVDDVVQETYLRLIRAKEMGRVRSTRSLLFGIARNISLNLHRIQRRCSFVPVNEVNENEAIVAKEDVVALVIRNQELMVTEAVIANLPDRCRQIVRMHALEGMSYREIAERLNLAEQTVRVQMTRAVRKCVSHLRAQNIRERNGL